MNQRPTILIVDDEPFNISILEQELDDLEYDTISASNGQEALDQVAAQWPDLVLLDIMMPIMDGFAVLAQLKATPETRDIPVIIISAMNDMPSVVKGIEQGAEDYLPKPFDSVLLQARISACLEKKRLRDQEVEYLHAVERLTQAAAAVEAYTFEQDSLAHVAARPDALGGLARVFGRMAREVHMREQHLRQQLEQVRRDIEERQQAARETVSIYVPMDRRHALARGATLPEYTHGAVLCADISGFTPLTELLAQQLGLQRGAEELTRQLNHIYGALIDQVHRYGGSVISFSGDAITCWFDDSKAKGEKQKVKEGDPDDFLPFTPDLLPSAGLRAVACGVAMQVAMGQLPPVTLPDHSEVVCMVKVAIVAGPVRRLLVGDSHRQQMEILVGHMLDALERGLQLAQRGEIVAQDTLVEALSPLIIIKDWRGSEARGQRFACMGDLHEAIPDTPWPDLPPGSVTEEQVRPWLLPSVYERVQTGKSAFLSELRPAAALFVAFDGIDYESDAHAGAKLDAFVQWVQATLAHYDGALLQITTGDKGSYLYAVFGAPIAHEDDPTRAVYAAMDLLTPPATLRFVPRIHMGLAYGQMRAGAYGSVTHRTYGVLGDQTNLAARLMQAATDILCDEAIYHAAQASVLFEALPPILVKGKEQPVAVYRPLARTPQSVIGSQIDQLAPTHQLTLKVASVIGHSFVPSMLRAVYPNEADKPHLDSYLDILERQGFITRHVVEGEQETGYVFRDAVTRDTVYNRLLFAQRRQLHRAVAEWYEQMDADTLAVHAALLVQHWSNAEDTAKTLEYLERAGNYARACGDDQAALRYFNDLLKLNAQLMMAS